MPSTSITVNSNSENQVPPNHRNQEREHRRMTDKEAPHAEIVTDDAILDLIHHQNKSMDNSTCTPMTFKSEINHFNVSPKLKKNPRDAMSPKRNRVVPKRKDYQYDPPAPILSPATNHGHVNGNGTGNGNSPQQMDMESSVQSFGDGGGASIQSQSDIAASVSGQSQSTTRSSRSHTQNQHSRSSKHLTPTKYASQNGMGAAGPNPYHQGASYQPSPTGRRGPNSVSSRSTSGTGTASKASKSRQSHSHYSKQPSTGTLIAQQEQELFEKRLCDASNGVAVRKIHSNGKSQLRHVKCIVLSPAESRSVGGKTIIKVGAGSKQSMAASVPDAHLDTHAVLRTNTSSEMNGQDYSSSKSVTSLRSRMSRRRDRSSSKSVNANLTVNTSEDTVANIPADKQIQKQTMALTWGTKKKVVIPLHKFTSVRKGKTTSRTIRNNSDPSLLLSIVTGPGTGRTKGKRQGCINLDIEAPTKLDRDKFAKAFAVFLDVPLEDDFVGEDVKVNLLGVAQDQDFDDGFSLQSASTSSSMMTPHGLVEFKIGDKGDLLPSLHSSPSSKSSGKQIINSQAPANLMMDVKDLVDEGDDNFIGSGNGIENFSLDGEDSLNDLIPGTDSPSGEDNLDDEKENMNTSDAENKKEEEEKNKKGDDEDDARSAVSSLTQGFDQEIVEELHQALNELRAELDASREEAARAVKVAEQAIQSAESCSSKDWNSTVTHKAAEAAALAQKRSAEAIAKQRLAQEKLTSERKSASYWRKQSQKVEEEAAAMQTRLAVAQVQRVTVTEELDREKKKAASYIQAMRRDYSMQEIIQRETLTRAAEQNRLLEIELEGTRRDLAAKSQDAKMLQDAISDLKSDFQNNTRNTAKKGFFGMGGKKPRGPSLLESEQFNKMMQNDEMSINGNMGSLHVEELLKIQAEASGMKKQFELLRRTTADELKQLPEQAKEWSTKASKAVISAQAEASALKKELALEISNRRKLLNEVQDLRGTIRVYCRPRPPIATESNPTPSSIISSPSHDTGLLHRDWISADSNSKPHMCFEFDRMFQRSASQNEVYSEMEELVLGCLDGFNACLMAYGESGSGKSYSMIGDFKINSSDGFGEDAIPLVDLSESGIHLLAARQLFEVSKNRKALFEDTFTLSILEIQDEKLVDLVAETEIAETSGIAKSVDDKKLPKKNQKAGESTAVDSTSSKLEIRANHEGDTIVQGLIAVPVTCFDDVVRVWKSSLAIRAKKLIDSGTNIQKHDTSSHIIASIEVMSTNVNTGIGTIGKLQFADLGASDAIQKRGSNSSRSKATGMDNILASVGNKHEWKFQNKSISTLADVIDARVNFSRNVPYRNSTLTHVLRDALEADTKTMLLVCVKSDAESLQNTANSLRFASKTRKVVIGKATKHHVSVA